MARLPYRFGLWMAQWLGVCVLCREHPIQSGFLCQGCEEDCTWLPPAFEILEGRVVVQSASFYELPMATAISAFKDKERLYTLPFLVHALSKLAKPLSVFDDAVILPMPTTVGRLKHRGFYPVGVLARYLSAMTGFALYHGVHRCLDGAHQRGLDRQERLNNVLGAFVVDELPQAETVILFDDVVTTGATLSEVAHVLLQANRRLTIVAVCLAHGSSDDHF